MRRLLYYNHLVLRKKSLPVSEITDEVKHIVHDLIRICSEHNGAGLSACQIGEPIRVFISCVDSKDGVGFMTAPRIFINPKLEVLGGERETTLEGCLSVPGVYEEIERPYRIRVTALDLEGKEFIEESLGYRARNICHEIDHLNGVLFFDHLSPQRRKMLQHQLKRINKTYNI